MLGGLPLDFNFFEDAQRINCLIAYKLLINTIEMNESKIFKHDSKHSINHLPSIWIFWSYNNCTLSKSSLILLITKTLMSSFIPNIISLIIKEN